MFGVTTPACSRSRPSCSDDFDCLVFHATGVGGRSMEKLVDSGLLAGVIDVTTTEVCDLLMGGVFPATEDRFGAIIRSRVSLCRLGRRARHGQFRRARHRPRALPRPQAARHNPQVTLMRTTAEENERMGRWIGERLNRMDGPVRFLLPEGGVSALDAPGQPSRIPTPMRRCSARWSRPCAQTSNRQLVRVPSTTSTIPNSPRPSSARSARCSARAGARRRAAR